MPPRPYTPAEGGSTSGANVTFFWENGHANPTHSATSTARWRITVTTQRDGGGTTKVDTGWISGLLPTSNSKLISGLPANGGTYYWQMRYSRAAFPNEDLMTESYKFKSQ